MRRQTKVLLGSGVLAVLVVTGFLISQQLRQDDGPDRFEVVATVNGEPIVYGELQSRTQAALAQGVLVKLQQLEARRQGLVGDISYRAALNELERVNDTRKQQVNDDAVVYGPVTYDEKPFLDGRLRELRKGLRAKLEVPDRDVERYYAENKARFSLGDSRTVAGISVVAEDGVAQLAEIERRLAAGESFDGIYAEVLGGDATGLEAQERSFDYRTIRTDSMTGPALAHAVSRLEAGEVTSIVVDARSAGIYKCVDRRPLGYRPLGQVRSAVVEDLRARGYDALVRGWRAGAKVEITQVGRDLGLAG